MKTNQQILGFMLVSALSLTSCTQSKNENPPDAKAANKVIITMDDTIDSQVIQNLSKNVITATYQGLADSASALHDQVLVLEKNRTQTNLNKAQDLWKQARVHWEATESFLFGPVESLAIDPMIDTWPLSKLDLNSIIKGGAPITAGVIRTSGTNLKGFHTVEFLLFGNGEQTNKKNIVDLTDRELEYLKATSEILAEDTAKLAYAWTNQYDPDHETPSYVMMLMNPGPQNELFSSKQTVLIQLINGMIGIADEVANGKIADPMGPSIEEVDVEAEESPFSWNSITDFSNNIRSIQMLYTGNATGPGIQNLLKMRDTALAQQVEDQIALAIKKIQDIGADGTPFGQAIKDPTKRGRVVDAQNEVRNLHVLLEQHVLPAMQ